MQSRIFFITSVFSVTWFFRNHYNLFDSRNISDYYQCWKQFCCFIFCVEMVIHYFSGFFDNIKFTDSHLFEFIKYINSMLLMQLLK